MRRLIFFFFLVFSVGSAFPDAANVTIPPAKPGTIYLKNGDRLTGTVEKLEDAKLLVKSAILGDLKIALSDVARIETNDKLTLAQKGSTIESHTLQFSDKKVEAMTSDARIVSVPTSEIQDLRSGPIVVRKPSVWDGWFGSMDAGMSAARGNTEATNLNVGLHASHTTARDRLGLDYSTIFAENNATGQSVTAANSMHSGARFDLNVSDSAFTFALANFQSDQLQNLDLRAVFGGGMGKRVAHNAKTSFNVFAGASMDQEMYATTPDTRTGELITGQELDLNISPRSNFSQRVMFFPNISEPGQFRVAFDSSALLKFNSWLGWQSTVSNTFVSNPPIGTRNNDLLVTTGIRVSFRSEVPFKPKLKMPTFVNF